MTRAKNQDPGWFRMLVSVCTVSIQKKTFFFNCACSRTSHAMQESNSSVCSPVQLQHVMEQSFCKENNRARAHTHKVNILLTMLLSNRMFLIKHCEKWHMLQANSIISFDYKIIKFTVFLLGKIICQLYIEQLNHTGLKQAYKNKSVWEASKCFQAMYF